MKEETRCELLISPVLVGLLRLLGTILGEAVGELVGHTDWIGALVFMPGGRLLVSGSADQTIRIWDVARRTQVRLFRGHLDEVWALAVLPDGRTLREYEFFAVEKEIEQESGFRARAVKLAALYDRKLHGHGPTLHHSWKAFFLCEITGGEARGSYETDAVGFFDPAELPEMSLGRSTPRQVARMLEHWRDRRLPADFD